MGMLDDDLDVILGDAAELGGDNELEFEKNLYACEPGQPDLTLAPDLAGDAAEASCTVLVKAADFGSSPPAEGSRVKYQGRWWRVVVFRTAVDGLEHELTLGREGR